MEHGENEAREQSADVEVHAPDYWVEVFDMLNPYRYNVFSLSIFCQIPLLISISIFSRIILLMSIFSKMTLSISIFSKSVDISIIDMAYRYLEHPYCRVIARFRMLLDHPGVQVVQSYVDQKPQPVDREGCNKVDAMELMQ